jgi:hypothetical protein
MLELLGQDYREMIMQKEWSHEEEMEGKRRLK